MIEDWDLNRIFGPLCEKGAAFADIFAEDTEVKSIVLEDNRIERVSGGRDIGVGLRAIRDFKTTYAYSNEMTESAVVKLSAEMTEVLEGRDSFSSQTWPFPAQPDRFKILRDPKDVSGKEEVELLWLANDAARSVNARVQQVSVVYEAKVQKVVVANSHGEATSEQRASTAFSVHVVATKKDVIQTGFERIAEARGFELLSTDRVMDAALKAAERAVHLLDARPAPSGPMTVVVSSSAGGTMVHEAVGHGLEADLAQEGLSVYSGKIGLEVASPEISVVDDATIESKRGSFLYDDEGIPAQRTVLIERGILKSYMYDRLTAMKDGVSSTGNGRRESYRFCPIPRMTNTLIVSGRSDPHEIISSVDRGLLVLKMGGGQVDTVNGDFVFEVGEAYFLKNGQKSDMVRGATLIGNGPKILHQIDMVGKDLDFGVGTCGKDGQGVPISDAQPTLRIPQMIVGGTEG